MRPFLCMLAAWAAIVWTPALQAQTSGMAPPRIAPQQPPQQPQQQQPGQPQTQPAQPGATVAPTTQPQAGAPSNAPRLASSQGLMINGESLTQMIDILAGMMKINVIIDPHVNGSVIVHTYGPVPSMDLMQLMQTILRVNGATMVQVGDFYRIVPINKVSSLPLEPVMNADPKTLPDDERMVLNLVFLKYTTAEEMDKLLKPFLGEGGSSAPYEPANLLILQDNSRSMKRIMEMIEMFDADTFAGQRVRLYDVENSRPADLVKELDQVFKAYAVSDKGGSVRFIPVDRINEVIAVAANPGIFEEVGQWIKKLDVQPPLPAGAVNNYVYRLLYGRAETLAMAITALYTGNTMALVQLAQMTGAGGMMGSPGMLGMMGGMGFNGIGGVPGVGGNMGYGGMGAGGMGYGGYGGSPYGYGGSSYSGYGTSPYGYGSTIAGALPVTPTGQSSTGGTAPSAVGQTGQRLGLPSATGEEGTRIPYIIPNPLDNTLLVRATPQEWEQIRNLVRQLDVPPRQVLIDAKIYELDLTGAFSSGVEAYLDQANTGPFSRALNIASNSGVTLSVGALVLKSKELLTAISLAENRNQVKTIATPSIIATDSIPAVMNVGEAVPVLTSSGVAVTGSSFNSVSNQSTGTTLAITARVNSSGVVTMIIDQEVSQPGANTTSSIDSPSFSTRSFTTQVTVQDGDTIAIGGFIQDAKTVAEQGIPFIQRIPILGTLFGSKSISTSRTELIIFLTPRVIYDTNQVQDAAEEIKSGLKKLQKSIQ